MSSGLGTRPTISVAGASGLRAGLERGAGVRWIVLMAAVASLLQVSVMPYVNIGQGIPDLVAPTVVVIALLRGTLCGALVGFACGLFVELAVPVGTLGVLALLYLIVGCLCGRYCGRQESGTILAPLVLSVAGALFVQIGYMLVELMLGNSMPPAEFVGQLLVPGLALTALLSPPVLLVARRLLGAPRVLEPSGLPL